MARPRKHAVKLPKHIHRQKRGDKVYYTFQKDRNTSFAGPRTRIPFEPDTPEFWDMYGKLNSPEPVNPKGSLNHLIGQYQQSPKYLKLKPNTVRDYDFYLRLIGGRLGKYDASTVSSQILQALYDSLVIETPVKAKKAIAVARALFAFGVPRGFAGINPARDIDMLSHKAQGASAWPAWALEAVNRFARWEVQTFVALALYTGQRTSDVVNMQFSDIRGDRLRVVTEKTGLELWIPIHRDLAPTIIECRARGLRPFVHSPNGKAMTPDTFRALYDRERTRYRVTGVNPFERFMAEKITPHGLRKLAVVNLLEAGVSEEDTGLLVGMSPQMVRHYGKGWDRTNRADKAIKQLEANGGKAS